MPDKDKEKPEKGNKSAGKPEKEIPKEAWDNFDKGLRKVFKPKKD